MLNKCDKNRPVCTARFLDLVGQKKYQKIAAVHHLICRIQNLLNDECGICSGNYCNMKDDLPLLTCTVCGQGAHNDCISQLVEVAQENISLVGPDEERKKINPCNLPGST